jgi:hypothetical protein
MKSNRNLSRGEGRRLGNVALVAFMLGSLLLLSVIRVRFSPIGKLDLCWSSPEALDWLLPPLILG